MKIEKRDGVRVVRCGLFPRRYCVNLFGTVWSKDISWIDSRIVRHERIHTAQMRELLFIPFYILYLLEYLFRLIQYRDHDRAYRSISFEREAYSNEGSRDYLRRRRPFAWLRYL